MEKTKGGTLFSFANKMSDLVILGLVWMVTSLPIITMGSSCIALYYAVAKTIRFETGKPVKEYFRAWKTNVLSGIGGTCILGGIGVMLYYAFRMTAGDITMWLVILAAVILVGAAIYYFPTMSRFTLSAVQCTQVSMFMTVHYWKKTLLLIVTMVLCVIVFCIFPFLLPLLAASYVFYSTFIMEPIFREYMNLKEEDAEQWFMQQ